MRRIGKTLTPRSWSHCVMNIMKMLMEESWTDDANQNTKIQRDGT
jgi:hypothetical protein